VECPGEMPHAVLQNPGKAHQQRQRQPCLTQLLDQPIELDRPASRSLRSYVNQTFIIDREITCTPVADAIDATAISCGPLAAIVFTCASNGHSSLLKVGVEFVRDVRLF